MPKRFAPGDFILVLIIVATSIFSFHAISKPEAKSVFVSITGKPYGEWALPAIAETVDVTGCMKLLLSPNGVRVLEASCPRGVCVHQGEIHYAGQSIVCVPQKIIIELKGKNKSVDAIVE